MNEAPKELHGREHLRHAAELEAALERGESLQHWTGSKWGAAFDLLFPFWRYRVAPKKIVRYVNIYPNGTHESRQAADRRASSCRLACVRIEYHEGQYDE